MDVLTCPLRLPFDRGGCMHPEERYYTTEQVAERLQVDVATVRRWLREGSLQGFRTQRHWRIPQASLDAFTATPVPLSPPEES
jgi:excisionase family DNA binding protein